MRADRMLPTTSGASPIRLLRSGSARATWTVPSQTAPFRFAWGQIPMRPVRTASSFAINQWLSSCTNVPGKKRMKNTQVATIGWPVIR